MRWCAAGHHWAIGKPYELLTSCACDHTVTLRLCSDHARILTEPGTVGSCEVCRTGPNPHDCTASLIIYPDPRDTPATQRNPTP